MMGIDLVFDIGNSRIKVGSFNGKQLVDSLGFEAQSLKQEDLKRYMEGKSIRHVLISSVNAKAEPPITDILEQMKIGFRFLDQTALKLILDVDEPEALGHDRIANSYGALALFPLNDCIVVDIGTAITADFIVKEGRYLGGMIYPGGGLCAKSLNDYTDKLPLVALKKPDSALAKTTETHLQAGIYYGQLGAVERMIAELRLSALSPSSVKVIATGGAMQDSSLMEDLKDLVDLIEPHLTVLGLREILQETIAKEE